MATQSLKYGSFTFPSGFGWHPSEDNLSWQVPSAKLPRVHGARVLPGYLNAKRLMLRGTVMRGPLSPSVVHRDDLDTLRAALALSPQNLQFYDDRYWRCVEVEEFQNPYEDTHFNRLSLGIQIQFIAADPFQYSTTLNTNAWVSPASLDTKTITIGGNAFALPKFSFTVPGSGTQTIAWTLSNGTTSESFTLTGDVTGGNIIVVDSLLRTVSISGTDFMKLFQGLFPKFNVGDNVLTITYGAVAVSELDSEWRNRWW